MIKVMVCSFVVCFKKKVALS